MAKSPSLGQFMSRHGKRLGAYRFVAGDTLEEALAVVRALNTRGMRVTLDHLGEGVTTQATARQAADHYVEALSGLAALKLDSGVSLKLTQMGLNIDPAFCKDNTARIIHAAQESGRLVRIDMEDSTLTSITLQLFRELRETYPNLGIVIQSYLRRSEGDVRALSGENIRFVKGAYMEPPDVAFPDKAVVDAQYVSLVKMHLSAGGFAAIATHDDAIIREISAWIEEQQIGRNRYEFQMLYGIRTDIQTRLVGGGAPVRIYVPYGPDWYAYFMRRLAERPANVLFFLRNLWRP